MPIKDRDLSGNKMLTTRRGVFRGYRFLVSMSCVDRHLRGLFIALPHLSEIGWVGVGRNGSLDRLDRLLHILALEGLTNLILHRVERLEIQSVQFVNEVSGGVAKDRRDFAGLQIEHRGVVGRQSRNAAPGQDWRKEELHPV